MKSIKLMLAGASLLLCCGCGMQVKESTTVTEKASNENAVIENMMSRRSIRKYKPQAVNRDTMQIILNCGINAPNGQNKQSWAIRVVDNPKFTRNRIRKLPKILTSRICSAMLLQ